MSKKIDALTPEQEGKIPEYVERYTKVALNTEPVDVALSEATIAKTFAFKNKPMPKFMFVVSPMAAMVEAAKIYYKKDNPSKDEIKSMAQQASYGSFESYWIGFYAFISEQLPVENHPLVQISKEIASNCGVYWILEKDGEELVIHTDRPEEIHLNADKKLHNPDGLALKYRDGNGSFCLNGVKYDSMMDLVLNNEFEQAKSLAKAE